MRIKDKEFNILLNYPQIEQRIVDLGNQISTDYQNTTPIFIVVLNGAFMFASDLFKNLTIEAEISFIKVSSYEKLASSGDIKQLLGLNQPLFQRDIIILEDIVDTGHTMTDLLETFRERGPKSIEIATLLFKPNSLTEKIDIKYIGFEIPDQFVVGYGLDYDGLGRNLKDIYQLNS